MIEIIAAVLSILVSLFTIIRVLSGPISLFRGVLQLTIEDSCDTLFFRFLNRSAKPYTVYNMYLSRTETVRIPLDMNGIIPSAGNFLLSIDKKCILDFIKTDRAKESKRYAVPLKLIIETSEGLLYSQWIPFRVIVDRLKVVDYVQHMAPYYAVRWRMSKYNADFICLLMICLECILSLSYDQSRPILMILLIVVLPPINILTISYISGYGTSSRLVDFITAILFTVPFVIISWMGSGTTVAVIPASLFFMILFSVSIVSSGWRLNYSSFSKFYWDQRVKRKLKEQLDEESDQTDL